MKRVLRVFVFAAASASVFALAQDYPSRAVRMLVPNAPGSSIDTMSRIVAAKLGDALGQSVFVENRDGAGGLIGVEAGKNAKPDGRDIAEHRRPPPPTRPARPRAAHCRASPHSAQHV